MKLYDPFADRDVEARRDPVSKRVVITKADTPATGTRSLEARTPDGKYASTANTAQVLRVRVRHHPRSKLVEIRHGARSRSGSQMGKALGAGGVPRTARALMRVGNVGARARTAGRAQLARASEQVGHQAHLFGRGAGDMVGSAIGSLNRSNGVAGKLGGAAALAGTTPALGLGVGGYAAGRHRGKKAAMAKSLLRGDPFGQRAPGVSHDRWTKANSSIPDAARHGRRLAEDERLRT